MNLTPDIPLRLDVNSGASETKLNLTDLKITVLNVDTGASSTSISLPAKAGLTDVRIDAGAASVDIQIPEDVAGRIRVESGLAGIHIDTKRFPKSAGIYMTPGYDEAENKADIFIHAGVGSIDVR